jgi:hypothetical protein
VKEAIGDALRNAAMRFGAALDLWAKSDLREAQAEHPKTAEDEGRPAYADNERPPTAPAPAGPDVDAEKIAVLDRLYLQAVDGRSNPLVLTQVRGNAAKEGVLEFEVDGPPPERKRMPFRELLDALETMVKQQQKAAQGGDAERSAA